MKAIETMVQKASRVIRENNLTYSPELFESILNAIKTSPLHIEDEKERQEIMKAPVKPYEVSRMTAYGKNKIPY